MTFVAEIDLAALDQSIWPGPRSGALSFFAAVEPDAPYIDSGGAALILHHPSDVARVPVEFPEALDAALRYREFAISARSVVTQPSGGQTATGVAFGLEDPDYDRLEAYLQFRQDVVGGELRNLVLGCPLIEDEALGDEDVTARLWPSLHVESVEHGLAVGEPPVEWRMLLQVSSDERVGTQFGDGGTLAFAIPAEDLAAGRFDRAQAFTDSL